MKLTHNFRSSRYNDAVTGSLQSPDASTVLSTLTQEPSDPKTEMVFVQKNRLVMKVKRNGDNYSGVIKIKLGINSFHIPKLRTEVIVFDNAPLTVMKFFANRYFATDES